MNLRRQIAQVRAKLEARHRAPPVACANAVDLWRLIYQGDPDPWQSSLLLSDNPRILLNCSRQSGKSTVCAIAGLYEALFHPPALVLLVSASLRQAQELGLKLFSAYRALGKPVASEAENRLSLELANGSRVVCLPSKEATVRGFSGPRIIIIDEASRVPDALYHTVRPMLAVSQGRLMCLSTPWGKQGFFFQEWSEGHGWVKVHITAEQCPRISREFLEEERRSQPEWWFLSEYYGVFGDTLDSVFRHEDIEAMLSDDVVPLFATGDQGGDGFLIDNLFPRA
jgi:hypothetical protein